MDKKNGNESRDHKSDDDTKSKDNRAPPRADEATKTPKKRRKVNHGMTTSACTPLFLSRFCLHTHARELTMPSRSYSMRILPSICKSSSKALNPVSAAACPRDLAQTIALSESCSSFWLHIPRAAYTLNDTSMS
jgi:hypothetical protein